MKKKILIWNTFPLIERAGGPSTYLYHLKQYFSTCTDIKVVFLDLFQIEGNNASIPKKTIVPNFVRNLVRINQLLINDIKEYNSINKYKQLPNIHSFHIIHFHTTKDLYQALPLLKEFKGKIWLTSHTPMAPHLEHFGDVLPHGLILSKTKKQFKKIDEIAFKRADAIVFPVQQALEPYFNTWKEFGSIIQNKKIIYIPTGIGKSIAAISRNDVLQKHNIPVDAIVLVYAGRHNSIKGYDVLKLFGKEILKTRKDIYFLILGKEFPMPGIKHPRWIEVGWTKDPHSYINASNAFILPNKQTYFDLVLLETLSLGKCCLLSNTGGNKHFSYLANNGFAFFEPSDISSMITAFSTLDFNENRSNDLMEVFEKKYSVDVFGQNYLNAYKNL